MTAPSRPGLYVHVPFCARACPYCDFDFEVTRRPDVSAYLETLSRELEARDAPALRATLADVDTLYVGGGTPSALGPDGVRALGARLGSLASGQGWAGRERTIELNPEHVDAAMVQAVLDAGFDRASLGVQSFDPAGVRELGRAHAPDQARAAVTRLRDAGLRVSVDLIVGWRGQTRDSLARDLATVSAAGVDHLSVYALTIEPGVPWHKLVRRGLRVLPDDDDGAEAMVFAEAWLRREGYVHYEVSSYGRDGARAAHNAKYWSWADYVGIGPSAASARYLASGAVRRRTNRRGIASWRAAPGGFEERETLDGERAAREGLWIGLRRLDGMDLAAFEARFRRPAGWLDAVLAPLIDRGDLHVLDAGEGGPRRVAVAEDRWLWHDAIAADLLAAG